MKRVLRVCVVFIAIGFGGCPKPGPFVPDFGRGRLAPAPSSVLSRATNLVRSAGHIEPYECTAFHEGSPAGARGDDGTLAMDVVGFHWRRGLGSSNFRLVQNPTSTGSDVWHYATDGARLDLGLPHIVRICARSSSADLFVATSDPASPGTERVYFVDSSGARTEIAQSAPMAFAPLRLGTDADVKREGVAYISSSGDLVMKWRMQGEWSEPSVAIDHATLAAGSGATLTAFAHSSTTVIAIGHGNGSAVTLWERGEDGQTSSTRLALPVPTGPLRGYYCQKKGPSGKWVLDTGRWCAAHVPLTFLRRGSGALDLLMTGDGTATVARRRALGKWEIASKTPNGANAFRYEGRPVRANVNGYRSRCTTAGCSALFVWEPTDVPATRDSDLPRPNGIYEVVEARPPFRMPDGVQYGDAEAAGIVGWEVRALVVDAVTSGHSDPPGQISLVNHDLRANRWVAADTSSETLRVTFDALDKPFDHIQLVLQFEWAPGLLGQIGTRMIEVERYPTVVYPLQPSPDYIAAVADWRAREEERRKEAEEAAKKAAEEAARKAAEAAAAAQQAYVCAPDAICAEVLYVKNVSKKTKCRLYDKLTGVTVENIEPGFEGAVDLADAAQQAGYWLLACDPNYWEMTKAIWTRKLPEGGTPAVYVAGSIMWGAP